MLQLNKPQLEDDVKKFMLGIDDSNISSLLENWSEVNIVKKILDTLDKHLKMRIKVFMKEKRWERYNDKDTKINVNMTSYQKSTIDKDLLKSLLTEKQLSKVTRFSVVEKLLITTAENRKMMNKRLRAKLER